MSLAQALPQSPEVVNPREAAAEVVAKAAACPAHPEVPAPPANQDDQESQELQDCPAIQASPQLSHASQ